MEAGRATRHATFLLIFAAQASPLRNIVLARDRLVGYCTVKTYTTAQLYATARFSHVRGGAQLRSSTQRTECGGIAKRGICLQHEGSSAMINFRVQRYVRAVRRSIRRRGCFMDCVAGRPNGRRNGEIPPVSLHSVCATRAFRVLLCVILAACLPICLPPSIPEHA